MTTAAGAGANAKVLSVNSTLVLRRGDVDILRSPDAWLNDQLVAFWLWLLEERHPNLASRVCLMPGSSSFLLLHADPSEARVIFEALGLPDKDLVLFAVNDNPDVEHTAGGSHWSCLAYHRPTNSFRHYDSSRPHNRSTARQLAGAAAPLVRRLQRRDGGTPADAQLPGFVEVQAMPQQQNGVDCGLFVCAAAQALCELLSEGAGAAGGGDFEEQERAALQTISSASVGQLRRDMLGTIEERIAVAAAAAAAGPS